MNTICIKRENKKKKEWSCIHWPITMYTRIHTHIQSIAKCNANSFFFFQSFVFRWFFGTYTQFCFAFGRDDFVCFSLSIGSPKDFDYTFFPLHRELLCGLSLFSVFFSLVSFKSHFLLFDVFIQNANEMPFALKKGSRNHMQQTV